jgi:hypothetical protein
MKTFKELREMTQRFVFDNPKSFKNAERLAKRFKLETDSEKQMGNYFLAVTGKATAVSKWLKALEKGEVSEGRKLTEANKQIEVNWDMDDPREYQGDFQDVGVYLDRWDRKNATIKVSGNVKDLLAWLVDKNSMAMDKRDAMDVLKKGKRVK